MNKSTLLSFLLVLNLALTTSLLPKDDFTVWGPGLKPTSIVMPARYFFVEATNTTQSCEEAKFSIGVAGINSRNQACRIWTNVLKTADCSCIVRYKLYETCDNFVITVKYDEEHLGNSPYEIFAQVYPDDCDCPSDLNEWLLEWDCGGVPEQITKDLAVFDDLNFDALRQKIVAKYDSPGAVSLCHYVIKSNRIHRKCYGKYVGFKMFMDGILLSLSRKIRLPDLEFFVNLGDWPLVNELGDKFPIFSWCGSDDSYDIVMPTYDITEATLENMGRVMLDMLSVQGNVKEKWKNRIPKVFWRGRDSSRERLRLIDISREHPDLFNVSLTNFFFFRSEEEHYGPKVEHVSFFSFFDYKYQLNLDGTVAAYRLPYLLAGGSLLLKQESKYYEHFYNELRENVHYVSVKRDLSDLVQQVGWAIDNDEEAHEIARAGRDFAVKNLLPKNIFCYHAFLLHEFSKKVISKVQVFDDMEIVENSKTTACDCDKKIKDEL